MTKLMRQSVMGDADICLKRLQFNQDPKIPRGTSEASAVGTAFHAAMEQYYNARALVPGGESINHLHKPSRISYYVITGWWSFDRCIPSDWEWHGDWTRELAYERIKRMITWYFEHELYWPAEYEVIGTEMKFTHPWIEGWDAHGCPDLVLRDSNGWAIIVDHKTSKKMWKESKNTRRNSRQAPWYVTWWEEEHPEDYGRTLFVYDIITYGGPKSDPKFERRVVPVEFKHKVATFKHAAQVAGLLDLDIDLPANPSSNLCSEEYCDHWDYCPYGKTLE